MVGHTRAARPRGERVQGGTGRGWGGRLLLRSKPDLSGFMIHKWEENRGGVWDEDDCKLFQRGKGGRETVISLQKQVSTVSFIYLTQDSPSHPLFSSFQHQRKSMCQSFLSLPPLLNLPDLQDASKGGRFPLILKLPPPHLGWQRLSQHSSPSAGSHSPRSALTGSRGNWYQREESSKQRKRKEKGVKVADPEGWGREKQRGPDSCQPCTLPGPHLAHTCTERCIHTCKFLYIWLTAYIVVIYNQADGSSSASCRGSLKVKITAACLLNEAWKSSDGTGGRRRQRCRNKMLL